VRVGAHYRPLAVAVRDGLLWFGSALMPSTIGSPGEHPFRGIGTPRLSDRRLTRWSPESRIPAGMSSGVLQPHLEHASPPGLYLHPHGPEESSIRGRDRAVARLDWNRVWHQTKIHRAPDFAHT